MEDNFDVEGNDNGNVDDKGLVGITVKSDYLISFSNCCGFEEFDRLNGHLIDGSFEGL